MKHAHGLAFMPYAKVVVSDQVPDVEFKQHEKIVTSAGLQGTACIEGSICDLMYFTARCKCTVPTPATFA